MTQDPSLNGDELVRFTHHRINDGTRHLHVYFKSTEVIFDFADSDEGFQELKDLVEILEKVMNIAMDEMNVRDELRNLDDAIERMLNEGDKS